VRVQADSPAIQRHGTSDRRSAPLGHRSPAPRSRPAPGRRLPDRRGLATDHLE